MLFPKLLFELELPATLPFSVVVLGVFPVSATFVPSFSIVAPLFSPLFPFCPISIGFALSPVFGKTFPLSLLFPVSLLFRFPLSAMLIFVLLLSSLFSTV